MQSPSKETPASTAEVRPMFTDAQMRALKLSVIAMGLVLLLGFAVVIGRIVYLLNASPRAAAPPAPASSQPPPSVSLPAGAVVRQIAVSGNRLAVYYEGPEGAGIRIVDIAGGPALTLPVVNEPPRRP